MPTAYCNGRTSRRERLARARSRSIGRRNAPAAAPRAQSARMIGSGGAPRRRSENPRRRQLPQRISGGDLAGTAPSRPRSTAGDRETSRARTRRRKDSSRASVASETEVSPGARPTASWRRSGRQRASTKTNVACARARGIRGELAPATGRERRVQDDAATRFDDLAGAADDLAIGPLAFVLVVEAAVGAGGERQAGRAACAFDRS